MAIGYDAHVCTYQTGTTATWAHTCSTDANRILIVGVHGNISSPGPTCTYAGVPMTEVTCCVGTYNGAVWYLVNPTVGANNVVLDGGFRKAVTSISFYGVDQVNPIRDIQCDGVTGKTNFTVALACIASDMLVGIIGGLDGWPTGRTWTLPLVEDCTSGGSHTSAGGNPQIATAHGLATASPQNVVCDIGVIRGWCLTGLALRPYVPALGRAVKYYFNIWDPKARVRDRNDRTVPPNELTADSWVEIQGHILPDPSMYDTYIVDPTKARIVEVTATETGATMRANRSQFADVLISRASAGRA